MKVPACANPAVEFSAVIPVRDDPVRLERLLAGLREHAPAASAMYFVQLHC